MNPACLWTTSGLSTTEPMAAFGTYAHRAPAILSPSNGLEIVRLFSQATLRLRADGPPQPGRGLLRWDRIDEDAGSPLEPRGLANPGPDLKVPMVLALKALLERRRMQGNAVERVVERLLDGRGQATHELREIE